MYETLGVKINFRKPLKTLNHRFFPPCLQDQTGQSTDPSRADSSRPTVCCAATAPLQAPGSPVLQTPDTELQTGSVLVEQL